jgi:universal stress protein E
MLLSQYCSFWNAKSRRAASGHSGGREPTVALESGERLAQRRVQRMSFAQNLKERKTPEVFRKILVATDFSPRAELATQRAMRLPLANRGTIVLAHILPPNIPSKYKTAVENQAHISLQTLSSRISRTYQKANATSVRVVPALRQGIPSNEVIQLAHSEHAELVVIGRHGHRIIRDLVLGSTAEKVIQKANVPVLVVNRKAYAPYAHPIIGLELTDTTRSNIALALRVVDAKTPEIALVHALSVPFEHYIPDAQLNAYRRQCQAKATAKISAMLCLFGDEVRWAVVVKRGDPRIVLLKEIKERAADLIVLGTHGGNAFSRALLGSVTAHVVRTVECDVLVSPDRE